MTPPVKPVDLETAEKLAKVYRIAPIDTVLDLIAEVRALREAVADLHAEREDWVVEDTAFHAVEVERDALRSRLGVAERRAEALRWLANLAHDVGKSGGAPEPGEFEAAAFEGVAALAAWEDATAKPAVKPTHAFEDDGDGDCHVCGYTAGSSIHKPEDATKSKPGEPTKRKNLDELVWDTGLCWTCGKPLWSETGSGWCSLACSNPKPAPPASKPVDRPADVMETGEPGSESK